MTYIPDGANKDYKEGENEKFYAFGWLGSDYDFRTGWESEEKKEEILNELRELPVVDRHRGWHTDKGLGLSNETDPYPSGSRKFVDSGTVYTAPNAVLYYIRELDYRPPDEVVDALLNHD